MSSHVHLYLCGHEAAGWLIKMKYEKNWGRILIVLIVLVLLVGCTALPEDQTPVPTSTPLLAQEPPHAVDLAEGFTLSLVANDPVAILNGESILMPHPPRIVDHRLYIPLKAVVELLGGTVSLDGDLGSVELSGCTAQYRIGQQTLILDDVTYSIDGTHLAFETGNGREWLEAGTDYAPRILDDIFYIPADFAPSLCADYPLGKVDVFPESRMAVYGGIPFETEVTVSGITLERQFDNLPQAVRQGLRDMGVIETIPDYHYEVVQYAGKGLEVYVVRTLAGTGGIDNADGMVCAIRVTGGPHRTARGLAVNDSAYLAWRLYGNDGLTNHFQYRVTDGVVSSITFYSRHFGSQF